MNLSTSRSSGLPKALQVENLISKSPSQQSLQPLKLKCEVLAHQLPISLLRFIIPLYHVILILEFPY